MPVGVKISRTEFKEGYDDFYSSSCSADLTDYILTVLEEWQNR